jgi:hypothetical protein
MNRFGMLWAIVVLFVCSSLVNGWTAEVVKTKQDQKGCNTCHKDFQSILPREHPPINNGASVSCLSCHLPKLDGKAESNKFSALLHRNHMKINTRQRCIVCHNSTGNKTFGIPDYDGSIGAPAATTMELLEKIFASWTESSYLDKRHGKQGVTCSSCHGKELPVADITVENERCLSCHGSYEKLAAKTVPKQFPDRNPHKNHFIQSDTACTICHNAHSASKVYCLDCHKNFQIKISGASNKTKGETP